ncbi:MAG: ABC transporter permease [Azospirillaceae bacterium]
MIAARLAGLGWTVGGIGGVLAMLEALGAMGALPQSVPAPSAVAVQFVQDRAALAHHLAPTLRAAVIGWLAAVALAIAMAGVALLVRGAEGVLYNFAVGVNAIPLIAAAPILVVWFGTGPETRVIVAALASFFPVLVGAIQGLRAVDRSHRELFHVLAAGRIDRLRLLELPGALPYLFAGLKISAAGAVLGAIVSEWVGADRGLGMMMAYALFSFNVPQVWMCMAVSVVLALGAYGLMGGLEARVVRWSPPDGTGPGDSAP